MSIDKLMIQTIASKSLGKNGHGDYKILSKRQLSGQLGLGGLSQLADFGSCRGVYSKQPYTEYISTRWYICQTLVANQFNSSLFIAVCLL
jgi:hypothetical protein